MKSRVIDGPNLNTICKIQTKECCRYLALGGNGFECVKNVKLLKAQLDHRVQEGSIRAVGDNCEGLGEVI